MACVDILVPVYNEAQLCAQFQESLALAVAALPYSFRFIYIDDGSEDGTSEVLRQIACHDERVFVLELSRNFGHQAALTAGLDYADADMVIMMDGDGQHPPTLIPEMIRLCESGYDIVQTQRLDSNATGVFKRWTASAFYSLLNRFGRVNIGAGVADFRLIRREVLRALQQVREYHRLLRGIIPWLGFRQVILPYLPADRIAGRSKYTLRKMVRLAADGLFSFSLAPLRAGILLGMVLLLLAVAETSYVLSFFLSGRERLLVPGWSSIIIMLTVTSGITMVLLGFIGVYVGMIFQQVKGRPIYIVRSATSPFREERNATTEVTRVAL